MPKGKVLIVSGNSEFSASIKLLLLKHGFKFIVAETHQKALEVIDARTPGAVLLDATASIERGFAFCKRLYRDHATSRIPVIFLYVPAGMKRKHGLQVARASRYITLPVPGPELAAAVREVILDAPAPPPETHEGARVLVVEDDRLIRGFIKETLEESGYEVITAGNGRDALVSAKTHNLAAVILNLVMPDMDGFSVCEELKRNPDTAGIPVIIESAKKDIGTMARAFSSGASRFLAKPFSPDELADVIRSALTTKTGPG